MVSSNCSASPPIPSDRRLPEVARACVVALGAQLRTLKVQILDFDRTILAWHRSNQTSKRLNCIPGVGPLLATALVSSVADPKAFRSGRNFSAWIGRVPEQHSSGGPGPGSAVSASRGTAICAACSWREHSPSSAMPSFMAPSIDPGSQDCWHGGRRKSLPSRLRQARPNGLGTPTGERYNYPGSLRGLTRSRRVP